MSVWVECPHCNITIEIIEVNCAIFRCGIFKSNGTQVPPHSSKEECDALIDKIWGCSRPFKYECGKAIMCDYI